MRRFDKKIYIGEHLYNLTGVFGIGAVHQRCFGRKDLYHEEYWLILTSGIMLSMRLQN